MIRSLLRHFRKQILGNSSENSGGLGCSDIISKSIQLLRNYSSLIIHAVSMSSTVHTHHIIIKHRLNVNSMATPLSTIQKPLQRIQRLATNVIEYYLYNRWKICIGRKLRATYQYDRQQLLLFRSKRCIVTYIRCIVISTTQNNADVINVITVFRYEVQYL